MPPAARNLIRDNNVSRNYRALKLAMWISGGSYWAGGLTERQTLNLVDRTINHPEVASRWEIRDIEVDIPKRGSVAWALPGAHPKLSIPQPACSPLIVLHEVAHLLKTTRRESHHGPGFTAIHLMLIELIKPVMLEPMMAAYHATRTPYDPSRIPLGESTFVPIADAFEFAAARSWLAAAMSSGGLSERERANLARTLKALGPAPGSPPLPPRQLPESVTIPTQALLSCNSDADIASAVLSELRRLVMPKEMRGKPKRR
jgi:hypothetical protein